MNLSASRYAHLLGAQGSSSEETIFPRWVDQCSPEVLLRGLI